MTAWRLVGDIGGSNARFARAGADGTIRGLRRYPVPAHASFEAALDAYLADSGGLDGCAAVAICAAGPLIDEAIALTNAAWRLDRCQLATRFAPLPMALMNDLAAVAHALPHLGPDALAPVGIWRAGGMAEATRLAVNLGTGFGAAALVNANGRPLALATEAGHMDLPAVDDDAGEALRHAEPPFRSVEDVLSGPGLGRLYGVLAHSGMTATAAEVFERLERDPPARQALQIFTALLGRAVGDLVLAHGAWGGVYLCGSVARAWQAAGDHRLFRARMADKGKMSDLMQAVPTLCIAHDDAALTGLAFCDIAPAG